MQSRTLPSPSAAVYVPVVVYAAVVLWAIVDDATNYDVIGGLVIAPVIVVGSALMVGLLLRRESDPVVRRIVWLSLGLKFAASLARYYVAFVLYSGVADAASYHTWGSDIAGQLLDGKLLPEQDKPLLGTGFVRIITGTVYVFTGPTKLAGFFVFSMFSFAGIYLFYRAFCIAFPDGDARLYAGLVFLLPSLLYWPSSIGKEAWLTLALGVFANGAARLSRAKPAALPLVMVALAAITVVRPHFGVLAVGGLGAATVLSRYRRWLQRPRPLMHRIGPVVLLVAGGVAASVLTYRLFESRGVGEILSVVSYVDAQTEAGGASFDAPNALANPALLPWSAVTVVARPFPFETHNFLALLTSLESTAVLGFVIWRSRHLVAAARCAVRDYYLTTVTAYVLGFVLAFSAIGNFAILARQRTLFYPFLFVLLCIPLRHLATRSRRGGSEELM